MSLDWDILAPIGEAVEVEVAKLHFDDHNPRFTPDKRPNDNTEGAVVEKLASTADLSELVQSIATSGYINIEPLIVVVREEKLVVLEGNRRLAAIKCLTNARLAECAKIDVPAFDTSIADTLEKVLVYRVANEADARPLIGFKHINGPQGWDAYAKAQFAGNWLDEERQSLGGGLSLTDIANRMGDQHATIHRMVTALYVLRQAERENLFSVEDRQKKNFSFSHLYTGLDYVEFTNYIGMARADRSSDPSVAPVPTDHFEELGNLLTWLYGSKSEELQPVIRSQNPDLKTLRQVLTSRAATTELEQRRDLQAAVITATPKDIRFSRHLLQANAELLKCQETLDGFDPEANPELVEVAISASKRASLIRSALISMQEQFEADSNTSDD